MRARMQRAAAIIGLKTLKPVAVTVFSMPSRKNVWKCAVFGHFRTCKNAGFAELEIFRLTLPPVPQPLCALPIRLVRELGVDHRIPDVGVPEVLLDIDDALVLLRKQ